MRSVSIQCGAAIDDDMRAGHERRVVRSQEQGDTGHLVRPPQAFEHGILTDTDHTSKQPTSLAGTSLKRHCTSLNARHLTV